MELEPILPSPTETTGQTGNSTDAESSAGSNTKVEKIGSSKEYSGNMTAALPIPATPQIPLTNTAITDQTQVQDQTQTQAPGPAIADDVDVIEKEWVDKAKSIVSSTKDNPHLQEKEVSKLQADYLMKRYGKKMKMVD